MRTDWQSLSALPSSDLATDDMVWFDFTGFNLGSDSPVEMAEVLLEFDADPGASEIAVSDGLKLYSPLRIIGSNGTAVLAFTVGGTVPIPAGVTKLGLQVKPTNSVAIVSGRMAARQRAGC